MSDKEAKSKKSIFGPWSLSLAGFIPFGFLAVVIIVTTGTHPLHSLFVDMFKIWSAIILSFLGGIRWGAAITKSHKATHIEEDEVIEDDFKFSLLFSVIPSIIALFALLLPSAYCIAVLMLCYCAQGAWDSISALRGDLPKWMGKLRVTLTIFVVTAHAFVFFCLL